jgi:hypothetical protein
MSLKDLPVQPTYTEDHVRETYVKELSEVTTPEQLWAFATRWRPLYLLTPKRRIDKKKKDAKRFRITQKNMQSLISMNWDPKTALECIQVSREGHCKHAEQYSCPGLHIMVPEVLLHAQFVGQHFGVSTDLALIQMSGGMGALER